MDIWKIQFAYKQITVPMFNVEVFVKRCASTEADDKFHTTWEALKTAVSQLTPKCRLFG